MLLSQLLVALDLPRVDGVDPVVRSVTRDSRSVDAETVFVAIVGATTDGHDYADCGAAVVFAERKLDIGTPVVVVNDTKRVLAEIAAEFAGHPATRLPVVGVTGTNGKTTVTTLAEQALMALGVTTGRVGTTGNQVGGATVQTGFTTPEAPVLQPMLADMERAGTEVALMEVSSIGLSQGRVDALPFHLAVFTNFTRDHLDFHGTMDAYLAAKASLFERLRPPGGAVRALICRDDPVYKELPTPEDTWYYGFNWGSNIAILRDELTPMGMRLEVCTPVGEVVIESRQVGRHNALNLVAALGIGLILGHPLKPLARAVGDAAGAPGRLEVVPNTAGVLVVVDYAHSDDALRSVIPTVSELVEGATWVVFGCGGDRDAGKRPRMGAVAEELADHVVITSDNPRSEDPTTILDQIVAGLQGPARHVDVDRRAAIEFAIRHAEPGDAVLIAGKGHETTQEIAGVKHPFDDREVARAALERR